MKTFIYLPLIALVILSSCKSSSFTMQRYTKYGHGSHKTTSHELVVITHKTEAKESKVETELVKENKQTIAPVRIITNGVTTLKNAILKPQRKGYDLAPTAALENAATASYSENKTVSSDVKPSIKSKKSAKREGLIGSALLTALWIVLVVIFIFLIIFLLSAVF